MIAPDDIDARAEALSATLRQKLGLRGASLEQRLARAGRALPTRVKRAGQVIVTAQRQAAHPKLAMMADPAPVEAAFSEITLYLKGVDPSELRKTRVLRWLGALVLNLIALAALMVLVLRWRGHL